MPAPYRRAAALLMLSLFAQGCATWRPAPEAPRPFLEHERPARIRVITKDGTTSEVSQPVLVGDEIRGFDPLCWDSQNQARTSCKRDTPAVSVGVDDVSAVQVRRISPGRTLALTSGIVAVVIAIVAAATWHGPNITFSSY